MRQGEDDLADAASAEGNNRLQNGRASGHFRIHRLQVPSSHVTGLRHS
jgi:hypothetical protein